MIDMDHPKPEYLPLKGGTLVGTFSYSGATIVIEKLPPRRSESGSYALEKGLRKILIDGEHRGYIVLPLGWGKLPEIHAIHNGKGECSYHSLCHVTGDFSRNVFDVRNVIKRVLEHHRNGKLRTADEITASIAKSRADREQRTRDQNEAIDRELAQRRARVAGLQSILDERMNLTEEQQAALKWAIAHFS